MVLVAAALLILDMFPRRPLVDEPPLVVAIDDYTSAGNDSLVYFSLTDAANRSTPSTPNGRRLFDTMLRPPGIGLACAEGSAFAGNGSDLCTTAGDDVWTYPDGRVGHVNYSIDDQQCSCKEGPLTVSCICHRFDDWE